MTNGDARRRPTIRSGEAARSAAPPIRYRRARRTDLEALLRLETEAFVAMYAQHRFSRAQFLYYLRNPKTICFVAHAGESLVGYVLGVVYTGPGPRTARMYSLAVDPAFRRHGIGTSLARRFVREAKRRACDRVSMETSVKNTRAKKLLHNLGMQVMRLLPNYYGENQDAIRLASSAG